MKPHGPVLKDGRSFRRALVRAFEHAIDHPNHLTG